MAESPEKDRQGDKQPEAVQQGVSSRLTATVVSLAALAILGAATANFLPNSDRFALPNFDRFSFPKFDLSFVPKIDQVSLPNFSLPNFSWPNFNRTSSPKSSRVAAQPPQKTAPTPILDPTISAALLDIQLSQKENAAVLASLTQSSAVQQSDLKRISRQVVLLTVQVDSLRGGGDPFDDFQHPAFEGPRSGFSDVAKNNRCSTAQACRPRLGRRRPAQSCSCIEFGRMTACLDQTRLAICL